MKKNHIHEDHMPLKAPLLMGYSSTYVKLAKYRVLFVSEGISNSTAAELSAMLLYFDKQDPEEIIEIYIHTDGGSAPAMLHIYDIMQMISAPIKTVCIGKCYSAGAVLLAAGTKGLRYAFKNSKIMIHGLQALFPLPGHDMTSSKDYFNCLQSDNDRVMRILADHTGHSMEKVREDCKQDVWLTAEKAWDYGIIDKIIV